MANQTELLNVGYEMKSDEDRQNLCELESAEELCSSSLALLKNCILLRSPTHTEVCVKLCRKIN